MKIENFAIESDLVEKDVELAVGLAVGRHDLDKPMLHHTLTAS